MDVLWCVLYNLCGKQVTVYPGDGWSQTLGGAMSGAHRALPHYASKQKTCGNI